MLGNGGQELLLFISLSKAIALAWNHIERVTYLVFGLPEAAALFLAH